MCLTTTIPHSKALEDFNQFKLNSINVLVRLYVFTQIMKFFIKKFKGKKISTSNLISYIQQSLPIKRLIYKRLEQNNK